ncbi:MAG: hypothetical protein VX777_04655 [Chlamydiota bacterium]|nr:hypothetical protein [Chlamydiota bacterium]
MATRAKESKQVNKVRKKLEKVLQEEHSHFNRKALDEVRENIHKWIARHEPERVSTEEKTFTLFDENRHPCEVKSNYVKNLMDNLMHESKEEEKASLLGRVSYRPN